VNACLVHKVSILPMRLSACRVQLVSIPSHPATNVIIVNQVSIRTKLHRLFVRCARLAGTRKTTAGPSVRSALLDNSLTQAALNAVSVALVDYLLLRAVNVQIARQVHTVCVTAVERSVVIALPVKLESTRPRTVVNVLVAKLVGSLL
jgi:hypothetical protein